MRSTSQILSFIFLVLTTSLTATLTFDDNHKHDQNHLAIVQITNSLPNYKNNSNPTMKIRCNSKHTNLGVKVLNRSEEFQWIVEEKGLYFCEALWGRMIASWHAFQPKRDAGHVSVFWLVEEDGIFLSWDNSSWVRRSVWENE